MSIKTKKILYWVTVALLITVIVGSVGAIAHKLITDELEQQGYEDLAGMRDNASTGTRPPIPADPTLPTPTVPTKPNGTPSILPELQELYNINNDMVGYIQIPGTIVDYPVVQSKYEANYYLRKNFYKEYAVCGTIYAREACDVAKPSDNVVLYGHNLEVAGTMFHDLIQYKDMDFWKDHRYIYFDTLTEYHTYEIFAVFGTSADPNQGFRYHIFTDAGTPTAFDNYVAQAKELSYYETGIHPQYGDKLLTLSTCDKHIGYGKDGRLVVMARRVV